MVSISLYKSMVALQIRPSLSVSRVLPAGGIGLDRRSARRRLSKIPVAGSRKLSVSLCLGESGTRSPGFETNTVIEYSEDQAGQLPDGFTESYPAVGSTSGKTEINMPVHEQNDLKSKRYAKLHDFCLGIPFGGIIFGGGLFGFLLSRNPASLTNGVLFGGAIVAMGVISLKVWRQGLSSLPFMLGQAALAATFFWKHLQVYSATKKIFPSGFYVAMSAAMVCFYSYVLMSGGNPPSKKKPASAFT